MPLSDLDARDMYESNSTGMTLPVDEAFKAMSDVLKSHGLTVPNDDRAEDMVTNIFMFTCDANGIVSRG